MPSPISMSLSKLMIPLSALGFKEPFSEKIGSYELGEISDKAMAMVIYRHGQAALAQGTFSKFLKGDLPAPLSFIKHGDYLVFWVADGQYMVVAPMATHANLTENLAEVLKNLASVVEQSDGWASLYLKGENLRPIMELLCNQDYDKALSQTVKDINQGFCTRTLIEHMNCFIRFEDRGKRILFQCPRSFAQSLHHCLKTTIKAVD